MCVWIARFFPFFSQQFSALHNSSIMYMYTYIFRSILSLFIPYFSYPTKFCLFIPFYFICEHFLATIPRIDITLVTVQWNTVQFYVYVDLVCVYREVTTNCSFPLTCSTENSMFTPSLGWLFWRLIKCIKSQWVTLKWTSNSEVENRYCGD